MTIITAILLLVKKASLLSSARRVVFSRAYYNVKKTNEAKPILAKAHRIGSVENYN